MCAEQNGQVFVRTESEGTTNVNKKEKKKTKKAKKTVATYSKADPPKQGDLCFAKVKGFVPWPAYVTEIEGGFVWVQFFNSTLKYVIENHILIQII